MEKQTPSPLEDIHAVIKNQNIFSKIGIVREQNVWGTVPDVTTLNAHASDSVLQALEQVKTNESHKVTSLVLTAQQGQGKTHLVNRVRHQVGQKGTTTFIYASAVNYTDLNLINYQFQQTVSDSLSRFSNQGVMQWQEIATVMINEVVPTAKTAKILSKQFDSAYKKSLAQGKNLLDLLCQKIGKKKPNIDPYIVRGILWTLSERASGYAIKWLAGNELEPSHAKILGLPYNPEKNNQDREAEALGNIRKILNLVGYYNSIVICFDEIEADPDKVNESGLATSQVVALLIKALYDTLSQAQVGKGVVMSTVMLPDTWRNLNGSLLGGTADRLSTHTQGKPIELQFVNSDSMVELVKLWLDILYKNKNLIPPHSIYPFDEQKLRDYAKRERPTVREALRWCADNFKVEEERLPENPKQRFELALAREREEEITEEFLEDSDRIAEILRFGFATLVGQIISGETESGEKINNSIIQEITDVTPKSRNNGWINFKIVGAEKEKEFKIGVAVIQKSHGITVNAGMERITSYETFDLTRGCLVRSKNRPIKKTWEAHKSLKKLLNKLGGEWVDLKLEEMQPLIYLYGVYQQRERYQLTEEDITQFSLPETQKNPLLLEILSDPSPIEEEIVEDDDLLESVFTSSSEDDLDVEKDELEELFDESNLLDSSEDIENEEERVAISEEPKAQTNEKPEDYEVVVVEDGQAIEQDEDEISDVTEITDVDNQEIEKKWFEKNYTKKAIRAFSFVDDRYEVNSWRDFLITICTLINLRHKRDIEKLLKLKGRTRVYVSKNPEDLYSSEKIAGTNLYIETELGANNIVKMVYKIITLFEYPDYCIAIELDE